MTAIIVPHLGESITEATLTKWLKNTGDFVNDQDPILELETEKITLEVYAPHSGILKEQNVKVSSRVQVGACVVYLEFSENQNTVSDKTEENKTSSPKEVPVFLNKDDRLEKRIPMSEMRKTVAKRLKEAQNTAAILTTFNEIDMSCVMEMRARFGENFQKRYGIKLGIMSFFVKAVIEALKKVPSLNASIEQNEIISKNYYDISVAISTPHGLVTPVLYDADKLTFADIEKKITSLAEKAKNKTLSVDELKGGTFTITNGGIFGSLLSTPILNSPQSGILGMHKIEERPVAHKGQVVIRPMMYVALSYDHRLIDGKDAVTFLRLVKDFIEYPAALDLNI